MQVVINKTSYTFNNQIRDNEALRHSLNALAQETFDLSFESWYNAGYWGGQYLPYTLCDGDKVVANVSVNTIDTLWQGAPKRCVQLGTVMTAPAYRKQGLARYLMRRVLDDWTQQCDMIYLYANDSVTEFYPQFGFAPAQEYMAKLVMTASPGKVGRLDMQNPADVNLLRRCYQYSNPFSALPMVNNWGLLMFYCAAFMQGCLYYVKEYDAVMIAEQQQNGLLVYDIFCKKGTTLQQIIGPLLTAPTQAVSFGFGLQNPPQGSVYALQQEDTTLFVLQGKENYLNGNQTMFPLLSHA